MNSKYSRIINKTFFLILMMVLLIGGANALTAGPIEKSNYRLYYNSTEKKVDTMDLDTYPDNSFFYKSASGKSYICYTGITVSSEEGVSCGRVQFDTLNDEKKKELIGLGYIINSITKNKGGIANLNNNQTAYYWSQMASLLYLGGNHTLGIKLDNGVINEQIKSVTTEANQMGKSMDELKIEADAYAEKYIKNISLQLSETELKFTLSGEYYASQKVYLKDINNNIDKYNITSNSENFEIVKDKDNTGDFFQVKIKKNNIAGNEVNATITINASNEYYVAKFYDCEKSDIQDLLATETEKKTKTATASISGTITITNKVVITKVDASNKKELPGATLEIQNEQGEIVKYCPGLEKNNECKWVSTEQPYIVEGLPNGTYYLVESIAPKGYVLNKEKVKFILNGKDEISYVQMINDLEVQVPDTLSSRSVLLVVISMFDIALGIGILTYVQKNKLRNE